METRVYRKNKSNAWYISVDGIEKKAVEWAKSIGISEKTMNDRILAGLKNEALLRPKGEKINTRFNNHYFDEIDSEEKAYWIGFIWADGSTCVRIRNNKITEKNLKLSLKLEDYRHLEKFNQAIAGNYAINFFKSNTSFNDKCVESRIVIVDSYLIDVLRNQYGLVPHRENATNLLRCVPQKFFKDFMRGLLDADGSFTIYECFDEKYSKSVTKLNVVFGACPQILKSIEKYLYENNIITYNKHKIKQRHPDRDGCYRSLAFCGIQQAMRILNFLYEDATVYLDRKYNKYILIKQQLQGEI